MWQLRKLQISFLYSGARAGFGRASYLNGRCIINRYVDIAVAAEGVGFTGETSMLDGDTLLASGIQLAGQ